MILKRLFIGDAGGDLTLYINYLGLPEDRALSQYKSVTWKVVLKRLFIGVTGKSLHIHCSGLPGKQSLDDGVKKNCSSGRQSIELIQ